MPRQLIRRKLLHSRSSSRVKAMTLKKKRHIGVKPSANVANIQTDVKTFKSIVTAGDGVFHLLLNLIKKFKKQIIIHQNTSKA
jgi:hypothetical protein